MKNTIYFKYPIAFENNFNDPCDVNKIIRIDAMEYNLETHECRIKIISEFGSAFWTTLDREGSQDLLRMIAVLYIQDGSIMYSDKKECLLYYDTDDSHYSEDEEEYNSYPIVSIYGSELTYEE